MHTYMHTQRAVEAGGSDAKPTREPERGAALRVPWILARHLEAADVIKEEHAERRLRGFLGPAGAGSH